MQFFAYGSAILFDDDDSFNLHAISKAVERLRTKLEKNGLPSTLIQTVRGCGYMLV